MAKKSAVKKSTGKSAAPSALKSERATDADRAKEMQRKASGNTLHGQQAAYYLHRAKARAGATSVKDGDVVVED